MKAKRKKNNKFKLRVLFYSTLLFVFLLIVLGVRAYKAPENTKKHGVPVQFMNGAIDQSELSFLKSKTFTFEELQDYFKKIAQEKGGEYAYELLRSAQLQPNVDMHLLGHAIGDELYKQQGLKGINICTQEFRNACSHSIVIGLFRDEGSGALPKIADACRKAPGGKGAYTMCFHGLGHGILAYAGYDLKKTGEFCTMTGTDEYGKAEARECMGGAVMEIVGGGGHDKEIWAEKRKEYLKKGDPLGLCTSDVIQDDAKVLCVMYITPFLFESFGGSIQSRNEEDIKKAFKTCETLTGKNEYLKNVCYGSFGKEFPTLAMGLDIRKIWTISDEGLASIYSWCSLADSTDGTQSCIRNAVQSFVWGGENDPIGAVRFCNSITDVSSKVACTDELYGSASYYLKPGDPKRKQICDGIYESVRDECKMKLLSNN